MGEDGGWVGEGGGALALEEAEAAVEAEGGRSSARGGGVTRGGVSGERGVAGRGECSGGGGVPVVGGGGGLRGTCGANLWVGMSISRFPRRFVCEWCCGGPVLTCSTLSSKINDNK